MLNLIKNRTLYEATFVVTITLIFGLGIGLLGALAPKFQIALAMGFIGLIAIMISPAKRTLCLIAWVLIQPLSIEKILFTATPIWDGLHGQDIVMNAGDVILIILAGVLAVEHLKQPRKSFYLNKTIFLFFALLAWSIISYLTHLLFYQSNFIQNGPLGILHLIRIFLFSIIILSAIKTRSDVIWVLIATMLILLFESALVFLTFSTGEVYNFGRLLGQPAVIQSYSGDAGSIIRASGTLGAPNQQGLFHSMFTFLLLGLFSVKNKLIKMISFVAVLLSFTAVIFTFSRSSWLCISFASIFATAIFIKRKEVTAKGWLIGSILLVVCIAALSVLAGPIIDRLTKGDNGATDSRLRMASLAKDLFLQYPIIGVGPGGYPEAGLKLYPPGYKETEWVPLGDDPIVPPLGRVELATAILPGEPPIIVPLPVHNKYLLTLSELGIVGLAIWLLLIYQFYKDAKICSQSYDPLFRYTGVAGLSIVLVAVLYMQLDLFSDEKTVETLLFPMLVVTAANRIALSKPSFHMNKNELSNKIQYIS